MGTKGGEREGPEIWTSAVQLWRCLICGLINIIIIILSLSQNVSVMRIWAKEDIVSPGNILTPEASNLIECAANRFQKSSKWSSSSSLPVSVSSSTPHRHHHCSSNHRFTVTEEGDVLPLHERWWIHWHWQNIDQKARLFLENLPLLHKSSPTFGDLS